MLRDPLKGTSCDVEGKEVVAVCTPFRDANGWLVNSVMRCIMRSIVIASTTFLALAVAMPFVAHAAGPTVVVAQTQMQPGTALPGVTVTAPAMDPWKISTWRFGTGRSIFHPPERDLGGDAGDRNAGSPATPPR